MKRRSIFLISILFVIALYHSANAESLPEGNTGIASRHPGDVGISSDPAVIFSDDFESYADATQIPTKWSQSYHSENIRIATEPGNFYSGKKALEFSVPISAAEISNTLLKTLKPTRDVLFLRYYSKYSANFNVVGSSHNGSTISSHYCCPGVPADGYNKFLISYEAGRFDNSIPNPGQLNVYIYHPGQRDLYGDHFFPNGDVSPNTSIPYNFGSQFIARPNIIPQLGRWYCYEVMLKANTPGKRDGRIALWLDGKLIADFMNIRLRDTTDLKIDQFTLDLHVKSNTLSPAKKWYDNVVAATSYIGPIQHRGESAPSLTLTSPNGGQIWSRGTRHRLAWSYRGDLGPNMRVILLKGGVPARIIARSWPTGQAGAGSAVWTIPYTISPGRDYKMKVVSLTNGRVQDVSNRAFTIQ